MSFDQGRTIRILIVEQSTGDTALIADAVKEAIGSRAALHVVHDKDGALDVLRQKAGRRQAPPDLILLDLDLPASGGHEVLKEIKADPELKRIPVVALTAAASDSAVRRIYDLHANCCVPKPMESRSLKHLAECIHRFWLQVVQLPGHLA